jgi:hypothetical protein
MSKLIEKSNMFADNEPELVARRRKRIMISEKEGKNTYGPEEEPALPLSLLRAMSLKRLLMSGKKSSLGK